MGKTVSLITVTLPAGLQSRRKDPNPEKKQDF